ncbi:hypothetical protein ACFFIX_27455 [Metabacillus herbersteinensis]|uniref:DUF2642 domain-containing protein n=1 Tax=Metabacillus herbersteinensis TaxID=283816 RepID=A0ABV6GPL0_9BACI
MPKGKGKGKGTGTGDGFPNDTLENLAFGQRIRVFFNGRVRVGEFQGTQDNALLIDTNAEGILRIDIDSITAIAIVTP